MLVVPNHVSECLSASFIREVQLQWARSFTLQQEDYLHYRNGVQANLSVSLTKVDTVPLQILLVASWRMRG